MSDGINITRAEFNSFLKEFKYLASYVKNSMAEKNKSRWMSQEEAMTELGCKRSTLNKLRYSNAITWKTTGKGKGIMILRKSVEEYNIKNSTIIDK